MELVILVGNQGSGKTTFAKSDYPNHVYISQDDQGKEGHLKLFKESLKQGKPIIIDRINHLRKQRMAYLDLAKEYNYKTKSIVMNCEPKKALRNLLDRSEHPTLPSSEGELVLKTTLDNYYRTYEYPRNHEGFDEVIHKSSWDPYMLDLSRFLKEGKKVAVIGDVHGCLDELLELTQKILDNDENTEFVFCGDLVDRGPKIRGVLNFIRIRGYHSVKGNHESKLQRLLMGNKVRVAGGLAETVNQVGLEDINSVKAKGLLGFLETLPLIIKLSDKDYVVHAGLNPEKPIECQYKENLIYTRNWNPLTKSFNTKGDEPWYKHLPETDVNIYFGHQIHEENPVVRKNVFALDGGCVHGGVLRAVILSPDGAKEFMEIKAKKQYCEKHKEEDEVNILAPYYSLVGQGLLRKEEDDELILFNYTDKCTFEGAWNEYTIKSRGIIFEKSTSKIVARPFPKFFNLGENESTTMDKIPVNEPYEVYEKMDGSLGIVYYYNNKWNVATRGSLNSDQAMEAQRMLDSGNIIPGRSIRFTPTSLRSSIQKIKFW